MSTVGIRSIVNADFIKRLGSLSGGDNGASLRRVVSGQGSSSALSENLRTGARLYSAAVQGINAGISFLNLSRSSLEALGDLTDKLITVVERAARPSTGVQTTARLQREFDSLTKDFKKVVEQAGFNKKQYLSVEGLEDLFQTVGLDPRRSRGLAQLFSAFELADRKDLVKGETLQLLASDRVRSSKPTPIPAALFGSSETKTSLTSPEQLTTGTPISAFLTQMGQISFNSDGMNDTIEIESSASIQGGMVPGQQFDARLLFVNENTGHSIISSRDNFLGSNGGNYEQLYVLDQSGNILSQLTDNSDEAIEYLEASLSDDSLRAAYISTDGATYMVAALERPSPQSDPGETDLEVVDVIGFTEGDDFFGLKMTADGEFVGFLTKDSETDATAYLYTRDSGSLEDIPAAFSNAGSIYFNASNEIVVRDSSQPEVKTATHSDGIENYFLSSRTDDDGIFLFDIGTFASENIDILGSLTSTGFSEIEGVHVVDYSVSLSASVDNPTLLRVEFAFLLDVDVLGDQERRAFVFSYDFDPVTEEQSELSIEEVASDASGMTRIFTSDQGVTLGGENLAQNSSGFSLSYNPGFTTVVTESREGLKQSYTLDNPLGDVTLLAVDRVSGYSIVASEYDLVNTGNHLGGQIPFLIDPSGRAVKKLFPAYDADIFGELKLDGPVQDFRFRTDLGAGSSTLALQTSGGFGSPLIGVEFNQDFYHPLTQSVIPGITSGTPVTGVVIGDDPVGQTLFLQEGSEEFLRYGAALTIVPNVENPISGQYRFLNDDTIVVAEQTASGVTLSAVDVNTGEKNTLVFGLSSVANIAVGRDASGDLFLAVDDSSIGRIRLFSLAENSDGRFQSSELGSHSYSQSSEQGVSSLALIDRGAGIELTAFGKINGAEAAQLFSFSVQETESSSSRFSRSSAISVDFLSRKVDLRNKPANYKLLGDLKELREQIKTNQKVVEDLSDYLGANLDVVRATGLAMLEIADAADSIGSAEKVARLLSQRIRAQERMAAAAHGGNLLNIARAALSLDEDSF